MYHRCGQTFGERRNAIKLNTATQTVSAQQALRAIGPQARVYVTQACGAPMAMMQALADERDAFEAIEICTGLIFEPYPWLPFVGENISLTTWQIAGPIQHLSDEGKVNYLPTRISQVPSIFSSGGPLPVDVVILQASPPDSSGYVSVGVSVSTLIDIARDAPTVIAEINRQTPRTLGNTALHVSDIDYMVDADYGPVQRRESVIGDAERRIAEHVADLIPDGATIQTGIGAIPEALLFLLEGKKDLGVHSGMVSDGYISLIEKGIITNSRKKFDRAKVVTGEAMGSANLYRYVDDNPLFTFESSRYIHDARVVMGHERFISINSAVEIDLGGQVNAESIGPRQLSGIGGQFDFVEATLYAPGSKSIIALPSTAAKGLISRVVPHLGLGAVVSTPRYCTDYVVTEYGTASLKGKTMRQRSEALVAIAHPDFRDDLANGIH